MGITRICINSIGEENWFSFRVALAWLLQLSLFALWKFGILYVKKREQKKMAEEDLES